MNARAPVVLILFGTRPEAIKLAPVAKALQAREEPLDVRVVSTGQHDDLLDSALASLELTVDVNLGIMRPDQDLFDVGVACLEKLRQTLGEFEPEVVVVEGDTATVFFGALAAFFRRTRVAHVEAGLRSHDKWAPFPEEIFRKLTDTVTDLFFAPTMGARDNLLAEGIPAEAIQVTGNTVIDAVQAIARSDHAIENTELRAALDAKRRLILITAHRRESFGEPIREAFGALRTLALEHADDLFVYPVHPNPNVRQPADELLSGLSNLLLLEPLTYADLVKTLSRAWLVITDSGGLQEEAPSFGVPVMVMREVTERPEGVDAGVARLVGTSRDAILELGRSLLDDPKTHAEMSRAQNPYGDGRASERIADILLSSVLGIGRRTDDWDG